MAIDELVFEKELLLRVIVVYDDHALTERTCQKWFARFKSGNFDLEEENPGAPPKFEDEELEARLDEDPTQTQKEP
ncbi:SETMAR [Cordylochernes scorpioides]|uniref:SETMAR n=1 Tax=Cordylochernes scorpioides TaxID=51811 RepID=A0ABY6LC35_9ARAC|nr:SETMAR [Cordylochernes scorpioides]